ncbi:glycosyltransferase [Streptomyces sp. NPDC048737]|uniref:glycosyltransferase n=1 Tax=unclassified Streptomyces TaxID=2593676 RepID=UPI003448AB51
MAHDRAGPRRRRHGPPHPGRTADARHARRPAGRAGGGDTAPRDAPRDAEQRGETPGAGPGRQPQRRADLVRVPSAKEEFGIAVLEAMEAGLPAAGPLRGGVAHYLRDGVNGILLDTSSASGLARGLHRLASLPEDRRTHLARAARETVTTRYSVADMAQALAAEYRAAPRGSADE